MPQATQYLSIYTYALVSLYRSAITLPNCGGHFYDIVLCLFTTGVRFFSILQNNGDYNPCGNWADHIGVGAKLINVEKQLILLKLL